MQDRHGELGHERTVQDITKSTLKTPCPPSAGPTAMQDTSKVKRALKRIMARPQDAQQSDSKSRPHRQGESSMASGPDIYRNSDQEQQEGMHQRHDRALQPSLQDMRSHNNILKNAPMHAITVYHRKDRSHDASLDSSILTGSSAQASDRLVVHQQIHSIGSEAPRSSTRSRGWLEQERMNNIESKSMEIEHFLAREHARGGGSTICYRNSSSSATRACNTQVADKGGCGGHIIERNSNAQFVMKGDIRIKTSRDWVREYNCTSAGFD
jgi:hypothetical protein